MTKDNAQKAWILPILVALIGGFMSILDSSIVNVALSTMITVYHTTPSDIEWVVTVYMLTLGVVIPFSGWAGDTFGYKKVYLFALAMFTFGSLLCTISWSVDTLIAARVVQALGGGLLMPTMMTMVKRIVPKNNFGTAMGIVGVALLIAPALGPTIGGYLVEYVGWKWIFTINLPIGVLAIVLCALFLPQFERKPAVKLDWGGAISAVVMLFCLLLALSKGNDWGWASPSTLSLLAVSVLAFAVFLLFELRLKNPLLHLRIFRYRNFSAANIMACITTVGLFSGIFYVPLFLQTVKGLGALETGLIMLPGALASGLLMPLIGKLYDRVGPKPLAIIGIISLTVTTFQLHGMDINTDNTTILWWMVLRGVSMAFASVPAQAAAIDSVADKEAGDATAITNILSRVSGSLGIAALTSVLTARLPGHAAAVTAQITAAGLSAAEAAQKIQGLAFVRSLDDVFLVASVLTVAGILPALFLQKEKKANTEIPVVEL